MKDNKINWTKKEKVEQFKSALNVNARVKRQFIVTAIHLFTMRATGLISALGVKQNQ